MKIFHIVLRIISYPFILCIILIAAFRDSVLWVLYGGEMFAYKKDQRKLISDVFEELVTQRKSKISHLEGEGE